MAEMKTAIPDYIKDRAKAAMEPLNKVEERLTEALGSINAGKLTSPDEMKKVFKDALKRVKDGRGELEKAFGEGVTMALSILNIPTRDDVEKIETKLAKLDKELDAISSAVGKPAKAEAKKTAKKPAAKKATKKSGSSKSTKKTKATESAS